MLFNKVSTGLLLFMIAAFVFSCRTSQKTEQPKIKVDKKLEEREAGDLEELILQNTFRTNTLSGRASVSTERKGGCIVGRAASGATDQRAVGFLHVPCAVFIPFILLSRTVLSVSVALVA